MLSYGLITETNAAMSKVDVDLSDSESSMDSVGVGKNDATVVDAPDARALPTYITIETTDGQLEHVKVG